MQFELDEIRQRLSSSEFWLRYLATTVVSDRCDVGIHVAIFSEPFLSSVLDGSKTVESRISRVRCAPFGEVTRGDVILIKEVAGPICGIALASEVWFFDLSLEPLDRIRSRFGKYICGDDEFWASRADAGFATLIELAEITTISPLQFEKRDRRGWVSLRSKQLSFAI